MNKPLRLLGDVAAIGGILVCGLSGAMRVFGINEIAGFGTMALFTVGIGMMVFACLVKVHLLAVR